MAKIQTRRTFSVSRATYDAVTEAAAAAGIPAAEWVTNLIRAAIPSLPPQAHATARDTRVSVIVPNATSRPPARQPLVLVRPILKGFCAICIDDRGPFFRTPIGKGEAMVTVCAECAGAVTDSKQRAS